MYENSEGLVPAIDRLPLVEAATLSTLITPTIELSSITKTTMTLENFLVLKCSPATSIRLPNI